MAPPQLPPELVADIIELTVELRIEEERHLEAHAPLSNEFLLSAALVNRTWHSIATPVLLKRGIVTSGSVVGYLAQVEAHGMEATLESVRFGEASGGVKAEGAAEEDAAFDLLVEALSELKMVEFAKSGSHFKTALPAGYKIREVQLSNYSLLIGGFECKFGNSPPTHLVVTETRRSINFNDLGPHTSASLDAVQNIFSHLQSFKIITNQASSALYALFIAIVGEEPPSCLRTCYFECTSRTAYRQAIKVISHKPNPPYSYPNLEHFACHLTATCHLLALGTQPNLTSLEVFPDLEGQPATPRHRELQRICAELQLIKLICALPTLENLRMPANWASEGVRKVCDAVGVTILPA